MPSWRGDLNTWYFGRHKIFHYPVDKLPGWRWLPTRQGIYPGSSDWQSGQIGRSWLVPGVGSLWRPPLCSAEMSCHIASAWCEDWKLKQGCPKSRFQWPVFQQVHFPFPTFPQSILADALTEIMDKGLVKAVGVCNYNLQQMSELQSLLCKRGIALASNQVSSQMECMYEFSYRSCCLKCPLPASSCLAQW